MSQFVSKKWVLIVATAVCVSAGGAAFAKGGGGHGGGGHGGGHSGGHSGGHHSGGHHGGGHHYYGGGHYYGGRGYFWGGYGLNYGGYGNYGWGNRYYYPQQMYSNCCPLRVANPVCVQNTCPTSTCVSGLPMMQASMAQVVHDGRDIVLFNPIENGKNFQYSLNGSPYLIKPGGVQTFRNDRTWTFEMDSGTGQHLRYTLEAGQSHLIFLQTRR